MPISVIPYLSRRTCPEISFHLSRVGTGRAAEPDTMSRILRQPSDIRLLLGGRGLLPGVDELHVDGGHGHEQRQTALGDALPDLPGIESGKDLAHRPDPEGAGDDVDDPVNMMQRQELPESDHPRSSPRPRPDW